MRKRTALISESGLFHRTACSTVRGLYRALWGATWRGAAAVPRAGPALIVSNHPSYLDPLAIYVGLARRPFFMAWKALFDVPWMGPFIRRNGVFPVDNLHTDVGAVRTAARLLREGRLVAIFPEGGRSLPDGRMLPFLDAPFRLALRLRVPVVPVTVNGSGRVWPRGRLLPRAGGAIRVLYHEPIPPGSFPPSAAALAQKARRAVLGAYRAAPAALEASRNPEVCAPDAHPLVRADRAGVPLTAWMRRHEA